MAGVWEWQNALNRTRSVMDGVAAPPVNTTTWNRLEGRSTHKGGCSGAGTQEGLWAGIIV